MVKTDTDSRREIVDRDHRRQAARPPVRGRHAPRAELAAAGRHRRRLAGVAGDQLGVALRQYPSQTVIM
jgi:hypothetical protein